MQGGHNMPQLPSNPFDPFAWMRFWAGVGAALWRETPVDRMWGACLEGTFDGTRKKKEN